MEKLLDRQSVEDILTKIYDKYPRLAAGAYGELVYKTEITDSEAATLMANAISRAIDRITSERDIPDWVADDLARENGWIRDWDISHESISKAMLHLRKVCAWHKEKHNSIYSQAWLLNWEAEYWNRLSRQYGGTKKKNIRKKFEWEEEID